MPKAKVHSNLNDGNQDDGKVTIPSPRTTKPQNLNDRLMYDPLAVTEEFLYRKTGATKEHLKIKTGILRCQNKNCRREFTLTERKRHCRRCGNVYCKSCTDYKRKLNNLAQLDPSGQFYQVCKFCHDEGPQEIGQWRSWSQAFVEMKQNHIWRHAAKYAGYKSRLKRLEQIDVEEELLRLKLGFKEGIGQSKMMAFMNEITPGTAWWQKSDMVQKEACYPTCALCPSVFNMLHRRHHCKICGLALCSKCCKPNLILYPGVEQNNSNLPTSGILQNYTVNWAIVNVVGCPAKEPDVCATLRLCPRCETKLTDIQVNRPSPEIDQQQKQFWATLIAIQREIGEAQKSISKCLPQYQEIIHGLNVSSGSTLTSAKSNTQNLAKTKEDLSESLARLITHNLALKRQPELRPETQWQETLLKNIILGSSEFYHDQMYHFREASKALEDSIPVDVLRKIQAVVDRNAINGFYLLTKQLALEVFKVSLKHQTENIKWLVTELARLEQAVLDELKADVKASGESWENHETIINLLLKERMTLKPLIKPVKEKILTHGAGYLESILYRRAESVLLKIQVQLESKCAKSSFSESRKLLKISMDHINETILISIHSIAPDNPKYRLSNVETSSFVLI